MIDTLEKLTGSAVCDVFSTMMGLEFQNAPLEDDKIEGGPHVVSSVSFVGKVTGVVYLYFLDATASELTCAMLGMEADELEGEEMVNDAMGEVANMVVGQLKSSLCDQGLECNLSIPSIVRGSSFSIAKVGGTERKVLGFQGEGERSLVVEILSQNPNG